MPRKRPARAAPAPVTSDPLQLEKGPVAGILRLQGLSDRIVELKAEINDKRTTPTGRIGMQQDLQKLEAERVALLSIHRPRLA